MNSLPSGSGDRGRRLAVFCRLVDDLLTYMGRFLVRHGIASGTISVQLHGGHIVKVAQFSSVTYPLPTAACLPGKVIPGKAAAAREQGRGSGLLAAAQGGGSMRPQMKPLTQEEFFARIRLRLCRLLRHFPLRFGLLDIAIKNGVITTVVPSPALREKEIKDIARLIDDARKRLPPDSPSGNEGS